MNAPLDAWSLVTHAKSHARTNGIPVPPFARSLATHAKNRARINGIDARLLATTILLQLLLESHLNKFKLPSTNFHIAAIS